MAPQTQEMSWRATYAQAFRAKLFDDFADSVLEEAQGDIIPDDDLIELREMARRRYEGKGYNEEGTWDVPGLAELIQFPEFLDAIAWDTLEAEAVDELLRDMDPERVVEGDLGGTVYLFDDAERAVYLSPNGVVKPKFDYARVSKAADAYEDDSKKLKFEAWFLRRL